MAAGQNTDLAAGHHDMVARIDIAQYGNVAASRSQTDQAHLARPERAGSGIDLPDHALDLDRVGGHDTDAAAGSGIQRAAGKVVAVAVERQRIDQYTDAGVVGAAGDGECILCTHQSADPDLRTRQDGDVGADIHRRDIAAQLHIAVGAQIDLTIAAGIGFAPGCGHTKIAVEVTRRINHQRAGRTHAEAEPGSAGASLNPDRAGRQQITAQAAISQHDVLRSTQIDDGLLAGPGSFYRSADDAVVLAGADAAEHGEAIGLDADLAVVRFGIELRSACQRHQATGLDFQQRIGFEYGAATGGDLGRQRCRHIGHGVAGDGGVAEQGAVDDQVVGRPDDCRHTGEIDRAIGSRIAGAGGIDGSLTDVAGECDLGCVITGAEFDLFVTVADAGAQCVIRIDGRDQSGHQHGTTVAAFRAGAEGGAIDADAVSRTDHDPHAG
jgi:hypothetical protein